MGPSVVWMGRRIYSAVVMLAKRNHFPLETELRHSYYRCRHRSNIWWLFFLVINKPSCKLLRMMSIAA
ncbi:hypothetical protein ACHAXH_009073 [Discostella pseudostelligera]